MAYCEHCDHCNAETLDGANLRVRRQAVGITLREMGRRVGISAVYLSDIERNLRRVKMQGTGRRILDELEKLRA